MRLILQLFRTEAEDLLPIVDQPNEGNRMSSERGVAVARCSQGPFSHRGLTSDVVRSWAGQSSPKEQGKNLHSGPVELAWISSYAILPVGGSGTLVVFQLEFQQ